MPKKVGIFEEDFDLDSLAKPKEVRGKLVWTPPKGMDAKKVKVLRDSLAELNQQVTLRISKITSKGEVE